MTRPEPGSEFLASATLRPQCDYVKVPRCFFNRWQCTVSHIMVTSLRSKWAAGKAVRAGLAIEGAYLNRYVTDEQRGRRPIFNATLRAAASWLFFCVARSTRMTQIWALYRQSGSDRLEKQQLTCGDVTIICETVH